LSKKKKPEDSDSSEVTTRDLFGSIPKPIDVDPFDGIDMEGISISKSSAAEAPREADEISQVSPLEGIDLEDISILKKRPKPGSGEDGGVDDINPLTGIDMKDLGVKPEDYSDSAPPPIEDSDRESWIHKRMPLTISQRFPLVRIKKPSEEKETPPPLEETSKKDNLLRDKLSKAYRYAEINRIRENVVKALQAQKQKTVMITSPHDDAGNTFLVSVLGFNAAYFTNMSVILIDLNMRRPFLHKAFGLDLSGGFSEIAMNLLDWSDAIKDTGLAELKILTAGEPSKELSFFLNRAFIRHMIDDIKNEFDLVLIDTSPVLIRNINNVDPVYLSTVCDMVILAVQDKMTSKAMLLDAVDTIKDGGGEVDGIVYNKQF